MIICNGNRIDNTFVSSGSVTAINKTGGGITKGDKVWIANTSQIAGTYYRSNNIVSLPNIFISPDGSHGIIANGYLTFNFDGTTISNQQGIPDVKDFSGRGKVTYFDSGTLIISSKGINGENPGILGLNGGTSPYFTSVYAIADGYALKAGQLVKLNFTTGLEEKAYTWDIASSGFDPRDYKPYTIGKLGDYFYCFEKVSYSDYSTECWYINEEDSLVTDTYICENQTYTNGLYPQSATIDNKYLICGTNTCGFGSDEYGSLVVVEKIADKQLKVLNPQELPIDLQPYTTGNWYMIFNPYSGYLTFAARRGQDYAIFKYEGGTFVKQSIDQLHFEEDEGFYSGITLANDGSRLCYNVRISSSSFRYYLLNLTTYTDQKVAFKYAPSAVTEDVITGYATQACEDGESFVASVGGVSSL